MSEKKDLNAKIAKERRAREDARRYLVRAADRLFDVDEHPLEADELLADAIMHAAHALLRLADADTDERALAIVTEVLRQKKSRG